VELLRKDTDQNIIVNSNQTFKMDLGWTENAEMMEKEVLYEIINPTENYETVRYIHKPYTNSSGFTQTDIWFYFYFGDYQYNTSNPANPIITGVTFKQDYQYLALPIGEKVFYTGTTSGSTIPMNDYIYFPVFMGSNYRNKENMYFFWFTDDTPFDETTLTGNTFYMTAKFYNAKTGEVFDFTNKTKTPSGTIVEQNDMYYKVIIDRSDYSYQVFRFNGSVGTRIGESNDPIVFYEKFL